jgi:hypothetical protein
LRAATDAGISLYDMLDRIHERGIPYELDPEVLERLDAQGGRHTTARVAEKAAAYRSDADSGIDRLREQFKPER